MNGKLVGGRYRVRGSLTPNYLTVQTVRIVMQHDLHSCVMQLHTLTTLVGR